VVKVLILGHGEHGKDTAGELVTKYTGLRFESSSLAASEIVVFPALREKYGYSTPQECYEDRRNHREEWRQLITEYNTPDKGRLCREILERCDGYIGMRCQQEYEATMHLFDHVLWIDSSKRKPQDPTMKIMRDESMHYIDNNYSMLKLHSGDTIIPMEMNIRMWARDRGLIC